LIRYRRIVELSHVLQPGREEFELRLETHNVEEVVDYIRRREDVWYILQDIHMSSHVGTHIELPYHHWRTGADAAAFSVERLIGEACVLDFSHKEPNEIITEAEIRDCPVKVRRGDIVFIRTGCDRFFRTERAHERPVMSTEAIQYLVGLGINCIGIDASPLCCLISRVKTGAWEALEQIEAAADYVAPCADSTAQARLFRAPDERELPEGPVKDFFDLAEMIARSDASRRRNNALEAFVRNRDRMLKSVHDHLEVKEKLGLRFGEVHIHQADARELPLQDQSVDGIVTSPPYSIALNYVKNDAHALEAMGYNLEELSERFIGVRGTGKERFELYEQDMRQAAGEMYRVLKPGAQCVVVIGNVTYQEKEVDTSGMLRSACQQAGLKLERQIDKIIFGLYNVMQREYVLFFSKPSKASAGKRERRRPAARGERKQ